MHKRVLCVDDNESICRVVADLLSALEVRIATSVLGALADAAVVQFDLFILDIQLPDGNGFELLSKLRAAHPVTPAIFITTDTYISRHDVLHAGAEHLIHKSSASFVDELLSASHSIIGRSQES